MQRKKLEEELEEVPRKIETLESEYQDLIQRMSSSAFYEQTEENLSKSATRLKTLEEEIAATYQHWQEIEQRLQDNQ